MIVRLRGRTQGHSNSSRSIPSHLVQHVLARLSPSEAPLASVLAIRWPANLHICYAGHCLLNSSLVATAPEHSTTPGGAQTFR